MEYSPKYIVKWKKKKRRNTEQYIWYERIHIHLTLKEKEKTGMIDQKLTKMIIYRRARRKQNG